MVGRIAQLFKGIDVRRCRHIFWSEVIGDGDTAPLTADPRHLTHRSSDIQKVVRCSATRHNGKTVGSKRQVCRVPLAEIDIVETTPLR